MRYILMILALMPLIRGQEERSITSQLRDAIEAFRDRMPCGFPEYGLPPMAPYKNEHEEFDIEGDVLQAHGEINDFRLYGLNDFDIVNLRVQILQSRITFKFNWNNVHLKTHYNVTLAHGDLALRRHGPAELYLKDLTVWGTIKYKLGITSGKLKIKELNVYVSLKEVHSEVDGLSNTEIVNQKLNRIIEEFIMLAVNDNTNNLPLYTNGVLLPIVNDFLSDKTVSDILGNGGNGEQEPCIPPEEDIENMPSF